MKQRPAADAAADLGASERMALRGLGFRREVRGIEREGLGLRKIGLGFWKGIRSLNEVEDEERDWAAAIFERCVL